MTSREEWEADPQGMMGGFLSQTLGMPELDGAIYPYVLTTQEKNDDGLYVLKAVPERLKKLTELVQRFLTLQTKPNSEKSSLSTTSRAQGRRRSQRRVSKSCPPSTTSCSASRLRAITSLGSLRM